jgi:hypothetical protein
LNESLKSELKILKILFLYKTELVMIIIKKKVPFMQKITEYIEYDFIENEKIRRA